jgi:hypothetical protein
MIALQLSHIDETLEVYVDRKINKLNYILYKVLNPNIECEMCHRVWDNISPCALCNATRAVSTGRI